MGEHDHRMRKRGKIVLIGFLLGGTGAMPGCISYVVATDPANPLLTRQYRAPYVVKAYATEQRAT